MLNQDRNGFKNFQINQLLFVECILIDLNKEGLKIAMFSDCKSFLLNIAIDGRFLANLNRSWSTFEGQLQDIVAEGSLTT